jgi:lipoprotein Spr
VGDLVFFKIKKNRISHVGVYLGNNKFAHSAVKGGVRIDSLDTPYYKKTFYKGGRL